MSAVLQHGFVFVGLLQGEGELSVLFTEGEDLFFLLFLTFFDVDDLCLQLSYECDVVSGDLLVVQLDVLEGLVEVDDELVDVLVLTLLHLVELEGAAQLHRLTQGLHLLLIGGVDPIEHPLEVLLQLHQLLLVGLPQATEFVL